MDAVWVESVIILALGAIATGVLSGIFGIGGGFLIVPLLMVVLPKFGLNEETAVYQAAATSLAAVIPISVVNVWGQYQMDMVRWAVLRHMIFGVIVGAFLGSMFAADAVSVRIIELLYFGMLCLAALKMILPKRVKTSPQATQESEIQLTVIQSILVQSTAMFVMIISSLVGVGGAILLVPLLSWVGFSLRLSIGSAAVAVLVVSCISTGVYSLHADPLAAPYSIGRVNGMALALLAPLAVLSVPIGARIARRLSDSMLSYLFVILMLSLIISMSLKLFVL
jgi:uncharacterized membrane protein YfcA